MVEIAVGSTPVNLANAIAPGLAGLVWSGRIQNRGPATVYRAVREPAAMMPNPALIRGWRHSEGSEIFLYIDADSASHWVWTADGDEATLVVESV